MATHPPTLPDRRGPDEALPTADRSRGIAHTLVGRVADGAAATAQGQQHRVADGLQDVAGAIHQAGGRLDGRQDWIASALRQGAAEVETLASRVRGKDLEELVDDVTDFARRRPAVFAGAALVAGFVVARIGRIAAADLTVADVPTVPRVRHD